MKKSICVLCSLLFVAACASVTSSNLNNARRSFANDNFLESASNFANNKDIANQDSLELLITGLSQFQAKNYNQSDKAFEEFNKRNIDTIGGSTLREAKGLLLGKLSTEYKPSMMDSLFVSYYQIWDAIGEGRKNDVRVIINQSYARQQDMSRAYADLVQKNQKHTTDENSELMSTLKQQNSTWAAYTDIMNPALMYLSGIWFLSQGDYSDARTYLQRATGMASGNSFIKTDLNLAENNKKPTDTTWVFIESGFAPMLQQEELSLPVMAGNGMVVVSIAVAEPTFNNSNPVTWASEIADVNAMFMTEFNEYRINDALRAFTAASARAVAQATAYNSKSSLSGLIGLGSTIFSMATTNAEVRSWVTLPERISVLRLNTANLIDSGLNAKLGTDIAFPKSGNYLIYVRLTSSAPIVHMFKI
jgi:hypothetical protein